MLLHKIYINFKHGNYMERAELAHIVVAILLMFVISGMLFIGEGDPEVLMSIFVFSIIVVAIPIIVKKAMAHSLDANVVHRIWEFRRFGFRPRQRFSKAVPFGVIVPLFFSLFSLGLWRVMTFLTYETKALKHRAAKRFGFYSYTSMTDWHIGLIGASGVVSLLLISLVSYFPGWETLSKMAAYYAFWNLVPFSKLDGSQIFFGSRILWAVLSAITLIFVLYGMFLPG